MRPETHRYSPLAHRKRKRERAVGEREIEHVIERDRDKERDKERNRE